MFFIHHDNRSKGKSALDARSIVRLLYVIKCHQVSRKGPVRVISSAVLTVQVKKNSSPLNQRDEEEILFSEKAPGPPNGWKRKQTCRVSSFVLLIRCIASIMVPGLFHTTERSFGNCSQIARSIPSHLPKVKENADEFWKRPKSLKLMYTPKFDEWQEPGKFEVCQKHRIYSGLRARMKALTNLPSMPAR